MGQVAPVGEFKELCIQCGSSGYGTSVDAPWGDCPYCDGQTEGYWIISPIRQLEFTLDEVC